MLCRQAIRRSIGPAPWCARRHQDGAEAMSLSYSVREQLPTATRAASGKTPLTGAIGRVVQWFARCRQWRDLRELDDRLLADVGISAEQAFRAAGRPLQTESLIALELAAGPGQRS